jgi:RNA polymerase sigma-70 factor, ECF subfamily
MTLGTLEDPDPDPVRAWAVAAVERGHVAWPEVTVARDELVQVAKARLAPVPGGSTEPDLHALDAAELYLAIACARGDRAALAQLRTHYFHPVVASLRRKGLGWAQLDDVWQIMCARLLVARDDQQPRILRYAGTGKLGGLIRVLATRIALNWLRSESGYTSADEWLEGLPAGHEDPEIHAIKRRHRAELKEEIEAAVARLSARERMVLRLHLVERLGIDAIAALCAVHRATAARSITRAKEALVARVRAQLIARWRIADTDLPALKQLVDSQTDLSFPRLFSAG